MPNEIPFEWFVLLLRVLFILIIYFFIFQVIRVISRELRNAASAETMESEIRGSLLVDEAGASRLRAGQVIPLDPVTVIGRNRKATIVIDSSFVSNEHTQITWERDGWWVSDLHSTNGTFVNDRKIGVPTRVGAGDLIEIGGVTFQMLP